MALALVRSLEQSGDRILLDVDTGTNPLFRVRLGREVRDEEGITVLDDVYWQSPWERNARAGRRLDTRVRVTVPASVVEPRSLVQVVTAKDGPRAAAYSTPRRVLVAPALDDLGPGPDDQGLFAMSTALMPSTNGTCPAFAAPTMIGVRSAREVFSRPASLDDLIGSLVQAALPLVQQLLAGTGTPATAGAAGGTGGSTAGTGTTTGGGDQLAATIAAVLRAALGAAGGVGGPGGAAGVGGGVALPHSLGAPGAGGRNRFREDLAAPMIFGIDDALIASLAGPILSSIAGPLLERLPELINSANQHRLDTRNADYQLINQLIASVDRNRLADRIAGSAGGVGGVGGGTPGGAGTTTGTTTGSDLAALVELLRSATTTTGGTASPRPPTPPPPAAQQPASTAAPVTTQSLRDVTFSAEPAVPAPSRVQLVPLTAEPITWMGRPRLVFVRDRAIALRWRLETGADAPAVPLPRAILRVVVRRTGGGPDLLQREERLADLAPGAEVGIQLDSTALEALPADTELEIFAQLRWPTAAGTRQCTTSQVLVLTGGAYVAGAGAPAGERVELTDMTRFRPFWNKVWSSPAPTEDRPLWGIDVTLRYSVVLADAPANALMEVRALAGEPSGGLRATTTGKMRSGLQVSVHELAKLRSLWPEAAPIDEATVAAFAAPDWLAGQGGDAEVTVRFDGRRHTRGLVWAVPVPALRSFTVARPLDVDPRGQVLSVGTSEVTFPVVEAVRVLGLTSTDAPEEAGDAEGTEATTGSAYAFEGYQVVHDTLVGLEPTRPIPSGSPA